MKGDHEITRLLSNWGDGDGEAFDRLMSLVYDELTRLASRALRDESQGHTLTTHALVHESYLNLVVKNVGEWQSRAQFFALASKVMRRILIDHARRRRAVKRGGGRIHLTLGNRASAPVTPFDHLMDLDEALTRLSERDARLGEVVECRFFGGMTWTKPRMHLASHAARSSVTGHAAKRICTATSPPTLRARSSDPRRSCGVSGPFALEWGRPRRRPPRRSVD